jgi:uncharacterized membrane protein
MKSSAVRIAENVLFALNILIVFLLVFGDRVVVPVWLQPVGRMHPMLLHFPIVILLLALLLEFFSLRSKYTTERFYQLFADSLLLIGAVTAGITAIMGMLLSKEGGYGEDIIQWHKIGGVCIVFISSLIYYSREATWFRTWLVKSTSVLAILSIVIAAHLGSVLTHGENFVLAPVNGADKKPVAFEEALVFDDLVKPILAEKCGGCHNQKKEKGGLILNDSASIVHGGKSGNLFDTSSGDFGVMLERLHLPLEEKKHMPPSGKLQLTNEELCILRSWIKSGPVFSQRVIDLSTKDSLRIIASAYLLQGEDEAEQYHFAAADEGTISKLNTNYRVVQPLSKTSPALAVSLFNRTAYDLKSLQELLAVKLQVVSLDLNKLPVKDDDLKTIAEFKNLRKLHLNFTDITGEGLRHLAPLKELRTLSVAGTHIDEQSLKQLASLPNLSSVVVWNTALTQGQLQQLEHTYPNIDFVQGYKNDGSDSVKLNPPIFKNIKDPGSKIFFDKSLVLHLSHPVKGTAIRYTLSGKGPDSSNSPLFVKDSLLSENTTINARAFKSGWLGSDTVQFEFYRSSIDADSVQLISSPADDHKGVGAATFNDKLAGDFNRYTEKWIGFRKHDLQVVYQFKEPVALTSVGLHVMMMGSDGIFPPASIEVWGGMHNDKLMLMGKSKPAQPGKKDKDGLKLIENHLAPGKISYLKIVARPLQQFPPWHKEKGKEPLLLVDEILLN